DTVETPTGRVDDVLGGGASYFAIAARFFSPVSIVAVVGADFKPEDMRLFTERNIDVRGIAKREGKTTRWHGKYHEDLNVRDTIKLQLNVLENFTPDLLPDLRRADYLYLAPNDPELQQHVLDQVMNPKVVVADLYDYWIENMRPGLAKVLERIQILLCSDSEARVLTGEHNIVKAGRAILNMGPSTVLIKRGEYGVLQFSDEGMFAVPAYPLEEVVDPTGAGDTFAGAMMGFLARDGRVTESSLRTAVVYGSVVASYAVERYSLERLLNLTWEQIDSRYREFINLIDSHHSRWTTQ
ncbi:MAG TPA: PfkB family carbohydrate kinase, partial [Candidatus Binatus sp.]|nr:PfkB family carbohydrate kinase [Candidatus Binatus sp.]